MKEYNTTVTFVNRAICGMNTRGTIGELQLVVVVGGGRTSDNGDCSLVSAWRRYLRRSTDRQLREVIDKYGDEKKYPKMCELIKAETDRRANADMERWYGENGERI